MKTPWRGEKIDWGNEMSVAIVGAAGFVGTYLRKALDRVGGKYVAFDKDTSRDKMQYLDVADCDSHFVLSECNALVNLAAEHRDDVYPVSRYDAVNVGGASNVCALATANGIQKIVFTSSVAIYGFAPPGTDETGNPDYFNHYGRTKFEAEGVYKAWQSSDPEHRTLVIIRPTVIFGPGNRGNVYNLLRQIASRRFLMFGEGKNVKSMAYVENVADFIVACLDLAPGVHIYNYVDKPDLTINELVATTRNTLFGKNNCGIRLPAVFAVVVGKLFDNVAFLTKRSFPVSGIRVKKFLSTTQFDSSANKTGFAPKFSLADGLEKTLRYEFVEDNEELPTFDTE